MRLYPFIEAEKARQRNVKRACELLKVSRSAYYAARGDEPSDRVRQDAELAAQVKKAHEDSKGRYGAPRVHAQLRAQGKRHSRKRVARLMRQSGLQGRAAKRWKKTTGTLSRVLRTPQKGHGHEQFIAVSDQAGDVAVHTARARDGLLVASVAAECGVPAADVLAAASALASAIAVHAPVARRSLFTLPLGAAPLWEITEQPAQVTAPDGREERCTAVLPAWSARSEHDLGAHPGLGFGAAAAALAALAGLDPLVWDAKQVAVARYSRTGFEAAAVTGLAPRGIPMFRPGVRRTAELRFGRPYAVVAVTAYRSYSPVLARWRGLPVFSAWITEPEDADEPAHGGPRSAPGGRA